jgi:pyruvate,water dikinase
LSHLEDLYPGENLLKPYPVLAANLSVASQGSASGQSLVIKSPAEMEKVTPGTILIVPDTAPVLVSVLPKVSALVAEKGSATGHLAIIAREFRVPMVIGFMGAGEKLNSGALITVDAYKGVIFEGMVQPLLNMTASLRENEKAAPPSPTQKILDEVLKYVAPLTLPDPRDPSFKPQSIQTFHDIIRFSHEKAITAMFDVNESRILKRGKTKHLVSSKVPLDIYIIDIGGGLKESHEGNKVLPEDITSIPMRYLYHGMTTEGVRWAGHIPIDFKGFVSVFANTMFDGSKFERRLGDRSYAIVSLNYVNFSSRLGYHFSILDAYVGPQTMDNYISFRFKGGAASIEKRVRRVQFIAEVMKRHGFWVDQNADLLNARVKRLSQPDMKKKLAMIGALMGSVRQLDVTMRNEDMVKHYVELFMQGDYSMGYGEERNGTAS